MEYSLQAWVNIGLNKGRGRFIIFSDALHPEKDLYSCDNGDRSTTLDYVIGVYFVNIIFLLIGKDTRPLLPIGWTNL